MVVAAHHFKSQWCLGGENMHGNMVFDLGEPFPHCFSFFFFLFSGVEPKFKANYRLVGTDILVAQIIVLEY